MTLYDAVRWTLLVLLFGSLLGVWLWSRRQSRSNSPLGPNAGSSFKVLQKRWVDQKTGICLVEAEEKTFLLAYTVGGSVSWQPLEKAAPAPEEPVNRLTTKTIVPGSDRK
jgi:flagellar biogenesis protein FliO